MILPLGDAPNPRGIPFITYALILANCAVYLLVTLPLTAQAPDPNDRALWDHVRLVTGILPAGVPVEEILSHVSAYDLFVFQYGFRPAAPVVVTLFSAMFLHAGFLHLFGNMLFLWIYGDNVETRLGRLPFLFWYLATGVAGTLFPPLFASTSPLPLIGASGAISGVLGFYFVWFPRNTVRLLFVFFPFFMNVFMGPARIVLGLYLLAENLLPFLITRGTGRGVAYGAHIGGFLAGLLVAWLRNRREVTGRPPEYRPGSAGAESGEGPGAAEAHVGAGSVQLNSLGLVTQAHHPFLDALDLDPSSETAARARAGLAAIAARQKLQIGRPRG